MGSFEENDNDILMEPVSYGVHDLSPRIGPDYQAEISFVINKSEQLRMNPADSESLQDFEIDLPISVTWSDADTKKFLLGLFIFGKNFVQIKSFLDNKGMGEILSFYYGKFYKTDGYRRWSECRKIKGRNCIIGQRLFTGPRQRELLSRLICRVGTESQDALLQVSKSYVEGITSLEEYISSLKSMVGIGVLVEAVGIGNEKGDLTRPGGEHGKNSRASSAPTRKALSSPYKKDPTKFMVIDTSLVYGGNLSDISGLKSLPINSVCKLEVYADGRRYKGKIYTRKVRHSKDMAKSVKQNSTKLTLADTNQLSEGKLLNAKQLRYAPVEFEDASTMATGLLRESNGGLSTDDLPRMVESKMLRCGKRISNSCMSISNSSATCKKEANDIPDNDAKESGDMLYEKRLKRIIKYRFSRRVRSGDSNHVAVPIKRRRLTACAKAEERRVIENSSGGIGSDKLGFSLSSSFPDSHQQNGSSTAFSTERIVEENNEKNIHNDSYQCTSEAKRTKICRLISWLIKHEDSEYYQKLREFEYKKTARNKLNQVVLQKHQKSLANEVNRETDEAVIKTQQAEEKNAEEIKVKQVEAGMVKEMQETEAIASSDGNQFASTSSAPNDDDVVILTKAKYERLLQSAEKVDKLEEKLSQILNLLQQRNIVISDELTTPKVQLLNL